MLARLHGEYFRCGLPLSSFILGSAVVVPTSQQQKCATIHYIVHFWFLIGTRRVDGGAAGTSFLVLGCNYSLLFRLFLRCMPPKTTTT